MNPPVDKVTTLTLTKNHFKIQSFSILLNNNELIKYITFTFCKIRRNDSHTFIFWCVPGVEILMWCHQWTSSLSGLEIIMHVRNHCARFIHK